MAGADTVLARAVSDGLDRLISADEPLASLQRSCGGELPGTIAVPELLDLVSKARRYQFRLARSISAQDGAEAITAWVEVEPQGADDEAAEGCEIVLRSWQSTPNPSDDSRSALERRALIDREVAELTARLDADQRILTVSSDSAELRELAAAMEAGRGAPFIDILAPDARGTRALHWRMLDGAPVSIVGSAREWRIVLLPQAQPGQEPSGFELLLVSDEPPPEPAPPVRADLRSSHGVVGQDLAPVLRQPIARIVANAETIRTRLAGPLPDAYADYAAEIANAGRLLLGLLEDLGDLEVVESAEFTTAPDPIDLAEVARQAAGILGVRAREKGIAITAPAASESLPAIAEFRRVLQVLLNLVGNAIRYAPEQSHVWISLERHGDRARVIVADQGPGLDEDDQAIVFEKFERLGRSGDGGSGLGLYISRRLARAMGGDLWVESTKGEGARFILEVPGDAP
jgi:signal transduction histidine kinase